MAVRAVLAAVLVLTGCQLTACYWNSSDACFGFSRLTKYNVSLDAESILEGPIYQLGEYEECVYEKQKQYCLATIQIYPKDTHSSFWNRIQERMKYRTNFRRDKLIVGLCVDELCNKSDIESAFFESFLPSASSLGVDVNVTVEEQKCQSRRRGSFTAADYVVGVVYLIIITTVLSTTIYEYTMVKNKGDTKEKSLILCFSIIRNWNRLTSPPKVKSLRVVQTMRVLLLYSIVLGHELSVIISSAIQNPEKIEKSYSILPWMLVFNGHTIVSTFFVISGFLLGYMGTVNLVQYGFTFSSYFKTIILRYIRLTPAYAAVIALSATWFSYMGSGPQWYSVYGYEVDNCRTYWWLNLLYLNNYIHGDKPCMQHSWYLAADYQNFIIMSLVLALVNKYKTWDKQIFGTALFITVIIPALQTYIEHLDPMLLAFPETIRNVLQDSTYLRCYLTFHHNASPYILGLIAGYIFYKMSINGTKLSKVLVAVMWTAALTLPWMILLVAYIFFQPSYHYDVIGASVFAGMHRTVFGFGMSNFLLLFTLGQAWIFNSMASWKFSEILGRLTYCAYLVHMCIIRMEVAAEKYPIYISEYYTARRILTDWVLSFIGGLFLCLFVELPSSALLNMLKNNAAKDPQKNFIS